MDDLADSDEGSDSSSSPVRSRCLSEMLLGAVNQKDREHEELHPVGASGKRIDVKFVARIEKGEEHVLRFTIASETPLARLSIAWCNHHKLPDSAARLMVGGYQIQATDTMHDLATLSVIPDHVVGGLPAPGSYARSRSRSRGVRRDFASEVVVRALPNRPNVVARRPVASPLRSRSFSPHCSTSQRRHEESPKLPWLEV